MYNPDKSIELQDCLYSDPNYNDNLDEYGLDELDYSDIVKTFLRETKEQRAEKELIRLLSKY